MHYSFKTYNEFTAEYRTYHLDKCNICSGFCEIESERVSVDIEDKKLVFSELFLLKCQKCGKKYLPSHSKQMIDGAYRSMVKENQVFGEFAFKGYNQKFEYCEELNYVYDHRDYYNIPGLCFDDEHSTRGFLTPVFCNYA